ncbi:unnamed protein product [Spirodela intermedia]|uniref:TLC domain-containing protein n=2 Tax=Spirodela intermedia TaxID=51605 RepID=A0A7I8JEP7_SPIIN|nr:unnamed protein product [Spirodela intermedia]CAA6668607.1 unnamed protein product [Spirodela intermedia]CAA7405497.1 unnamed protein product [Spirodela intermedia]
MSSKSYGDWAKVLVNDYLLADPFVPYVSVLGGIFVWKMVYDLTRLLSLHCIKTYPSLTKIQQTDWNNRGMSSIHAFYIAGMSLYLLCFSDLFSGSGPGGLVVFRRSLLSNCALGVSVGYFIVDLGMILWLYPLLGGMEYVVHHLLSVSAISHSVYSGEGQFYAFLVLMSEITTPGINLRWFLDTAGLKKSPAYLVNGIAVFFAWAAARILLFVYLFYHLYLHYDQVVQMSILTYVIVISVPSALAVMNLVWFRKIVKGMKKTLAKRQ